LSINPASNFHTIILDLLTHSGLVVRTEGTIRTTAKGEAALGHSAGSVKRRMI
jgi:hypothetical protein